LPAGADQAQVREAVAAAVLVGGFVGASAWAGAVQTLSPLDGAGRVVPTLLMIDNCEHVLAGAAAVIAELIDAVPGVTIVATSREPIGWVDEQVVTVAPLSGKQSLELFRQRAELAGHPISGPGQVGLAEQICRHMHGHPLFIRLAAARMFYEPLPMILAQLSGESEDGRLRWRHGPRAGSEQRHRTITDVIGWSYQLCGDKQKLLFDRLSVFAPGYDSDPHDDAMDGPDVGADLEAIEVVCADDVVIEGCPSASGAGLARAEIRELLERLVDQSLVSIHISAATVRYSLLESLRVFAAQRLAERSAGQLDEPARLARRHCFYYRDKLAQAQVEWFSPAEEDLLTWAIGAWSNIRRAIDTSLHIGDAEAGLQLGVGVLSVRAPFLIGSLPEIRGRIEQALAATQASRPETKALAVAATAQIAWLALVQGCPQDAEEFLERAVVGFGATRARVGRWQARLETETGLPAALDYAWGADLMLTGRDRRAIDVFARARQKFHRNGDRGGEAMSELFEALAAGFFGSAEQAMTICERHLERTTAIGAGLARSWAQMAMAIALTKQGDPGQAVQLGRDALAYQIPLGDQWGPTWAVHIRMWSLAQLITNHRATTKPPRATLIQLATEIAYLAGGVKTQHARLGVQIDNLGPFAEETSRAEQIARDVLGSPAYTNTEKRGSALFVDRSQLQRLAAGTLSTTTSPTPAATTPSLWPALSLAEQEVAILAAAGWPNSAIGVRRGTTTKTTDAQMSSIFQKLMIKSRKDIATSIPPDQRHRISAERSRIPRQSRDKPRSIHPQPDDRE
jgi:predicted ATPase/DNA-binding CsgD family transcriptional regulator